LTLNGFGSKMRVDELVKSLQGSQNPMLDILNLIFETSTTDIGGVKYGNSVKLHISDYRNGKNPIFAEGISYLGDQLKEYMSNILKDVNISCNPMGVNIEKFNLLKIEGKNYLFPKHENFGSIYYSRKITDNSEPRNRMVIVNFEESVNIVPVKLDRVLCFFN